MATLTIEIPKSILKRKSSAKLLVVDPKEFEKELRREWEIQDAFIARKTARREYKTGKARELKDLKELTG
ncbi:MAG: hypothetical protein Q8Q97_00580 [bacterium]|nr:hypothetical protein [bacterium]